MSSWLQTVTGPDCPPLSGIDVGIKGNEKGKSQTDGLQSKPVEYQE